MFRRPDRMTHIFASLLWWNMGVRNLWPISILAVLFCSALPSQGASGQPISVSEAGIAFHLFPETRVEVPVFNHANRVVPATLVVEMLGDDSNRVITRHETAFEARLGRQTVTLAWDLNELPTKSVNFLSAYRLRYTLAPRRNGEFQPVQGILQMGRHMVDGFGIQGYPSGEFSCALDCSFLVRVAEPNSGRALAGYDVKAEFGGTVMHVVSDEDGYATLHYQVPSDYARSEVMMNITVSHGPFSNGWGGEIFWRVPPHLTLTTDKQTYHTGETVRMHVVLTDVHKQRWAGGNVSLTITNSGDTYEIVKKKLVTLQTGEAAAEWTIPGQIENGRFSITATSDDEPQGNWTAKAKARIVVTPREQLKFVVSAVPDRPYYLPGQIANLKISATEFAGNPIRRGKVDVKGSWDLSLSGELDDDGALVAAIDPKKMWKWIVNGSSPGWQGPRSWDFPVDVTVADIATGRTEVRHVILRLAPQEIHIVIDGPLRVGSEKTLGIVASYVDKSPASVTGAVEATAPDTNGHCSEAQDTTHVLGEFQTNGFGVARLALQQKWIDYAYPKREDGAYSWYSRVPMVDAPNEQAMKDACVLIRAADSKGKTGTLIQQVAIGPETHFGTRISTNSALYRPGDPIRVRVESDSGLTEAVVEIRTPGWELAAVQHIRLVDRRAELTLPYTPAFRGLLIVQVYAVTGVDDPNIADSWSTDVIYPTGESMKAGERWGDDVWRPDLVQPENPNVVELPDEAEPGRIAGIEKEDLLQLDPAKPFPDGMDLVAWELLGPPQSWGGWSWGYYDFRHEQFDKENLAAIRPALQKIRAQNEPHPTTEKDLMRELKELGIDFESLRDGWGTPYRLAFLPRGILVVSSGADKIPNTKDDYVADRIPLALSSADEQRH
jgi:hypothetical protein